MPLPLPNLDTRRWEDLIAEGQALIPRYAPTWTDHNVHDPGITLMELLAWLVEQEIYRANRVPERHRRKFLALAGFAPAGPQPAQTPLRFALAAGSDPLPLPAGLTVAALPPGGVLLPFRLQSDLTVVACQIEAVQSFDGEGFSDLTRPWREGLPLPLFGEAFAGDEWEAPADPEQAPALYLGFDEALPAGVPVTLWFALAGGRTGWEERERLAATASEIEKACAPPRPRGRCEEVQDAPDGIGAPPTPAGLFDPARHHTVRIGWDYFDGSGWQELDAEGGAVLDTTRAFTLDGAVRLTIPGTMVAQAIGSVEEPAYYVRARVTAGPPDTAPVALAIALNATSARQQAAAHATFRLNAGADPSAGAEPVPGTRQRLALEMDDSGAITALAAGADVAGPEALVLAYEKSPGAPGALEATLVFLGVGDGLPAQSLALPDAPVAGGEIEIWVLAAAGAERWQQQPDLDASERSDAHFALDATAGAVRFGDGERGRVLPAGSAVVAAYDITAGAAGNISAHTAWTLAGADDALNEALLGRPAAEVAGALAAIANSLAARAGQDEETVDHAAGRAAAALWAHERLLELCPADRCATLDEVARERVLEREAPRRATTALDFERLALEAPGTTVRRARAWPGLDAHFPCLQAPGTVTVVIVPDLPAGRPAPTPGLLQTVRAYLERRRVMGSRLVVVGPRYLEVTVRGRVQARNRADRGRVAADIVLALDGFLDPLGGGPDGGGWPFGRDVFRSEILQVIDNVKGVDHVIEMELIPGEGEAQCHNLCVGATWLVTPGAHEIEVL